MALLRKALIKAERFALVLWIKALRDTEPHPPLRGTFPRGEGLEASIYQSCCFLHRQDLLNWRNAFVQRNHKALIEAERFALVLWIKALSDTEPHPLLRGTFPRGEGLEASICLSCCYCTGRIY